MSAAQRDSRLARVLIADHGAEAALEVAREAAAHNRGAAREAARAGDPRKAERLTRSATKMERVAALIEAAGRERPRSRVRLTRPVRRVRPE